MKSLNRAPQFYTSEKIFFNYTSSEGRGLFESVNIFLPDQRAPVTPCEKSSTDYKATVAAILSSQTPVQGSLVEWGDEQNFVVDQYYELTKQTEKVLISCGDFSAEAIKSKSAYLLGERPLSQWRSLERGLMNAQTLFLSLPAQIDNLPILAIGSIEGGAILSELAEIETALGIVQTRIQICLEREQQRACLERSIKVGFSLRKRVPSDEEMADFY